MIMLQEFLHHVIKIPVSFGQGCLFQMGITNCSIYYNNFISLILKEAPRSKSIIFTNLIKLFLQVTMQSGKWFPESVA